MARRCRHSRYLNFRHFNGLSLVAETSVCRVVTLRRSVELERQEALTMAGELEIYLVTIGIVPLLLVNRSVNLSVVCSMLQRSFAGPIYRLQNSFGYQHIACFLEQLT